MDTSSTPEAPPVSAVPTTFEAFVQDQRRVNAVMDEVYRRGDRLMCVVIALHLVFTVVFSAFYDTWFASAVIGGVAGGMFYVSVSLLPRHRITRIIAGISLQTFVALHIWQMHGLAEMHFFFFTAFTAMVVYQDGPSMWPGTILIILQHIIFAVLHNSGVKLYFFEADYVGFAKLFFHFGIAVMQVALCGFWAHFQRRQALLEAFQRESLQASQA
jgi:methyl-accepting chemotaxis protein